MTKTPCFIWKEQHTRNIEEVRDLAFNSQSHTSAAREHMQTHFISFLQRESLVQ